MCSVREIGNFVGIPEDSPEFGSQSPIGLRLAGNLVAPISTTDQERSLRGLCGLLETLVPISLDATLLSRPAGVEPYALAVRLVPSQGLIISTHVLVFLYGELMNQSPNYGAGGGDVTPIQLGPGSYGIVVRRSGIGNSGYERLEKALGTVPVTHTPGPPQPPPPAPVPPHIDVRQNGSANATTYTVTGTGFLPNQPASSQGITVWAADDVDLQNWVMLFTGSDASGKISLTTGAIDTTVLPRNAAGQAILNFSATDKRKNPNSVPANQPLYSNTVTFRY